MSAELNHEATRRHERSDTGRMSADTDSARLPSMAIELRRVTDAYDRAREGFIDVYQRAFAGPPYFESYTREDVERAVWRPHVARILVVAERGGLVVGLGCAHPLLDQTEPAITEFLLGNQHQLPFDPSRAIFMSEVAVLPEARGAGLGTQLVKERLRVAAADGFESFVMRTAAEGSNSRGIYLRLGARQLPFRQFIDPASGTQSTDRIYMWGNCSSEAA